MMTVEAKASASPRDAITIITRMNPPNTGNQALSAAWIGLIRHLFPAYKVYALEREPAALMSFELSSLEPNQDEIWRSFSHAADKLLALPRKSSSADTLEAWPESVKLAPSAPSLKHRLVRRFRRHVGLLNKRLSDSEYSKRLETYRQSALVIANPAGEFDPSAPPDTPARLLLDLYVASRCGAATAIVNHSVEVEHQNLKLLIPKVYSKFDAVLVRETSSKEALVALGVDDRKIRVATDAVFWSSNAYQGGSEPSSQSSSIGLALNSALPHTNDEICKEICRLVTDRFNGVSFISNCWKQDAACGEMLAQSFDIELQARAMPVDQYVQYLRKFELIISARLHTLILAMSCGIPVIPIEGQIRRVEGIMRDMQYPLPTVQMGDPDWREMLERNLEFAKRNSAELRESIRFGVMRNASSIEKIVAETLSPLLSSR